MMGIIPYTGLNFCFFYTTKEVLEGKKIKTGPLAHFLIGASGSIIAQSVSYPFDIVRKKLQAEHFYRIENMEEFASARVAKSSALDICRKIMEREGLRGFYKGIMINYIKGPIASGITFTIVEFLTSVLRDFYEVQ
eukprot:CAMPEP_0115040346 /NCGR_PEP_ID=MMETSP0216-20121206/44732_1 /TAXON_ID=223996 /ORGANISM="Protocruzia adherens, Strain Boccale" /LENGTH=135 /DNA_ID=CAMNT_0002421485 /DNA_START=592 /DNA_END=999 /DNA_ORIENTATION=-